MKRPVTKRDTTPSSRVAVPTALVCRRFEGAPCRMVMMPQFTVTAAKNDMQAANRRIAFGVVKVGDLRNNSRAIRPRTMPTVSEMATIRGTIFSWI